MADSHDEPQQPSQSPDGATVAAITAAYAEIGEYYRDSVEVMKFTLSRFQLRATGVCVAAAYIVVEYPEWKLIAGLVLLSGAVTSVITAFQMRNNMTVIQRAMAAGALLEYRCESLGFLYRSTIPEEFREAFDSKYSGGTTQMSADDVAAVGQTPTAFILCLAYALFFVGASIFAFLY